MKKILLTILFLHVGIMLFAQTILLPAPVKTGGKPLIDALNDRQTIRSISDRELDEQTLSNLLWAACGFNREDKKTVPSSQNRQEIDLYVMFKSGVYIYDVRGNALLLIAEGDLREGLGNQSFAHKAPVNLICVANVDIASNRDACFIDSGFILQNVGLFCASEGLANVIRGSFNKKRLPELLRLTENQIITITQVVGYPE